MESMADLRGMGKKTGISVLVTGIAGAVALAGAAQAGGFSRGTADTDILFESGKFAMRIGAVHVTPQRGYDTITFPNIPPLYGPAAGQTVAGTDGDFIDSYTVPSSAFKTADRRPRRLRGHSHRRIRRFGDLRAAGGQRRIGGRDGHEQ